MSDSFDLEAPDHFTTGAVGPPGQRVFYLQGRERGALVTLKVEKGQVNALSEYIGGLLGRLRKGSADAPERGADAPERGADAPERGADAPERGADAPDPDDVALIEPIEPAWAVASIGVGYDETTERVVIVAQELVPETEEDQPAPESAPEPASARFHLTREQAMAFVARAQELVRAGRPMCPLCSQPKDPEGHICPRANGHVAPRE